MIATAFVMLLLVGGFWAYRSGALARAWAALNGDLVIGSKS